MKFPLLVKAGSMKSPSYFRRGGSTGAIKHITGRQGLGVPRPIGHGAPYPYMRVVMFNCRSNNIHILVRLADLTTYLYRFLADDRYGL